MTYVQICPLWLNLADSHTGGKHCEMMTNDFQICPLWLKQEQTTASRNDIFLYAYPTMQTKRRHCLITNHSLTVYCTVQCCLVSTCGALAHKAVLLQHAHSASVPAWTHMLEQGGR